MPESLPSRTLRRVATAANAVATLENWPTYFADYAGRISARRVVYSLRNGLRYEVRPRTADRGIFTEVWLRDDYRRAVGSIRAGDVVIDLGAQVGFVSTFIAFRTGGVVYAYEPFPENFELLNRNVSMNGLEARVFTFNIAVSQARGDLPSM